MDYKLSFKRFGEHAILVEWPSIIDKNILNDILFFKQNIAKKHTESKVQLTHGYNSLLVSYNFLILDFFQEVKTLKKLYDFNKNIPIISSRLWKIPVCYDAEFGIDLDELSKTKNLTNDEIIQMHSEVLYLVYFIGFLPGFLYLGGLNEKLQIPRKDTPRLKIEKGAVGIGGNQTGIYPSESPGGWHIIGNSPVNFFNVSNDLPCFAKSGDSIKFYPVSLKEYRNIKMLVDAGVYQFKVKELYD